jgi:arabinofuranosyltransferase
MLRSLPMRAQPKRRVLNLDWAACSVRIWHSQGLVWALVAVAFVTFATQFIFLPSYEVDDAWISFSYAKNLATGHGPTFAHGGRVEGYSNFLWVALLTPLFSLAPRLPPLDVARALNVPFVVLLAWSTFRMVRSATGSSLAGALALCLLATASDLAFGTLSGLESFAYTAVLTAGFALNTMARDEPAYAPLVIPAFVIVALMRIDGFVSLAFILTWTGAEAFSSVPTRWRAWLRSSFPGVVAYLAWFSWRWWYYRMPLPCTYYAKSLISVVLPNRGIDYVWTEVLTSRLYLVAPAIAALLWTRNRSLLPAVAFVSLYLAYVARVGGDWMPFGRFVIPVLPLLICFQVIGGRLFLQYAKLKGFAVRWAIVAATVCAIGGLGAALDHRFLNSQEEVSKVERAQKQIDDDRGYRRGARLLAMAVPSGARLVTDYPGTMAYYTDAYIIDMFGLTTPSIALEGTAVGINPLYGRTCPSCYPMLHPQFFHVNVPIVRGRLAFASPQDVVSAVWQSDTIGRYVNFRRDYCVGRIVSESTDEAVYFLEERNPRRRCSARQPSPGFLVEYPFEPPA